MKIAGYIEHPYLKITVFQMNNRYSVKFETGALEQTYKFSMGEGIESFQDIRKLMDQPFIGEVEKHFKSMTALRLRTLEKKMEQSDNNEFDKII